MHEDPDPELVYTVIRPAPLGSQGPGRHTIREPSTTPAPAVERPSVRRGLEIGEAIGVGSMGTVRVARQLELDRDVAVKIANEPRWEKDLAREARVLGSLEHPNVVPVHGLAQGPDGELLLLMKRVEGHRWSEVLASQELTHALCAGRDPFLFQLEVLLAVTDAVAFAHSKGIVHRDLKPDNVLVGRFGQVFVVDWGLAVATTAGKGLPLAGDVKSVAGTPAFMAPEQALAFGSLIGPRTDVYLLGALLYHLVTGELPHPGREVQAQLEHAARAKRLEPDDAPEGLARIVRRATAEDPSARHASAAELRTELQRWLDGRGAERLVVEALRLRGELEREVAGVEARSGQGPDVARALLTEARFAFRQAHLAGRTQGSAARGLEATLALGVRLALARRDAAEARHLLGELPTAPPDLAHRVEQLERRLGWELAEVEALRRQTDVRPGALRRGAIGAAMGGAVGGFCALLGWMDATFRPLHYPEVLLGLALFDGAMLLGLLVPRAWTATAAVRTLRLLVAALTLAITLHWLGAAATGAPIRATVTGNALLSATILAVGAGAVDRWMLVAALPYLLAWLAGLAVPSLAFLAFGLATAASFTVYAMLSGVAEALARGR